MLYLPFGFDFYEGETITGNLERKEKEDA